MLSLKIIDQVSQALTTILMQPCCVSLLQQHALLYRAITSDAIPMVLAAQAHVAQAVTRQCTRPVIAPVQVRHVHGHVHI